MAKSASLPPPLKGFIARPSITHHPSRAVHRSWSSLRSTMAPARHVSMTSRSRGSSPSKQGASRSVCRRQGAVPMVTPPLIGSPCRHPTLPQCTMGVLHSTFGRLGVSVLRSRYPSRLSVVHPQVWLSVRHTVLNRRQDAMAAWTETRDQRSFTVCMREAQLFSGGHRSLIVDWIALEDPSSTLNITEVSSLTFVSGRAPRETDNFASCKVVTLAYPYYTAPSVIVAANASASSLSSDKYAVSAWIEEINTTSFRACAKELIAPEDAHQEVTVEYLVVGDIHPCLNVTCEYFAECQAFAADDAQCVCPGTCPAYVNQVCATNGQTFDNECLMQQHMCRNMANFTFYHDGSCKGFPMQKGRRTLDYDPSQSELVCETIRFAPYSFYPDKRVHVVATVNHNNHSGPSSTLDAPATWVENVSPVSFTVCTLFPGRYERRMANEASVDWLAYQGAPANGVTGQESFSRWWTGTSCKHVTLPKGKMSRVPTVLVTAEHTRRGRKSDAAMTWVEDVRATGFTVCLRELQNFDGAHEDILVNWMAFDTLHRPLFKEHGNLQFNNRRPPPKHANYAFCRRVDFVKSYGHAPAVLLTPGISTNGQPSDGAGSWVEHLNASGFDVCVKQVYDGGYSPFAVYYAVVSDVCGKGWTYFRGFCYKTSQTCLNWRQAQSACAAVGSALTSIHNPEENVFIQQQHNGAQSWVGLNDVITEGAFVWVDGSAVNFTQWAQHQPNNYNNQDCVHTLGVNYGYKWNDVQCTACHNFTCRKDYDECSDGMDDCDVISTCVNTPGSYTCTCPAGYTAQAHTCNDVNECGVSDHCHANSTCANTVGSYTCTCKLGFTGDGINCTDIDECMMGTNRCHANARCSNTIGSYTCQCNSGHQGNGLSCADVDECGAGSHGCHANAHCVNTPGSYICRCNNGYYGDGKNRCNSRGDCSTLYRSGNTRDGGCTPLVLTAKGASKSTAT